MNYVSALPLNRVRFHRGFFAERTRLVHEVMIRDAPEGT